MEKITQLILQCTRLQQCILQRSFSVSPVSQHIQSRTRMRVVDNSELGQRAKAMRRAVRVIAVYNTRKRGFLGDKVLVAICGQKKKGYIVGVKGRQVDLTPKFDTNNLVLIDDMGSPIGTRITVPIPHKLRTHKKHDFSKIMAIATKFV